MRTFFVKALVLLLILNTTSILTFAQLACTPRNQITNTAWDEKYNIIFSQNFEHHNTPIEYTTKLWNPDWNNPGWRDGDHRTEGWWAENIKDSIVVDSETNSTVLKLNFKDTIIDGVNGYHAYRGGDLWLTDLGQESKEMYFSYNLKFRPGFEFVKGGKLPGTRGGTPLSHETLSNSLPPADDEGYSCYLLFKSKGRLQWYLYHHDRTELYGDAITWDDFQPEGFNYLENGELSLDVSEERWYNITVRVVVNTITNGKPNRDGLMEGFVDGKLVSSIQGLYLIPASDINKGVNTIAIANFFGGGGNDYGPIRDEWTLFDDFVCFTYDESINVPRGNTPSQAGRVLELPNLKSSEKADLIPPTTPQGVRSKKKTGSSIDLSWESSQDNTGVAGYRIFLNGHEKGKTEANSIRINGLLPETTYSISVSAYDDYSNESDRSPAIFVTTSKLDTIPPPVPTGVDVIDSTEKSIDISWDYISDTIDIEAYNIYVDGELIGATSLNFYSIVNLEPQTYYSITVTSIDESLNESEHSDSIQGATTAEDVIAPSAPTGLTTSDISENEISLYWNKSNDNVEVIGYYIYVNGRMRGSSLTNSYTVTGLYSGTMYSISITAYDYALNESLHSEEVLVATENPNNSTIPVLPEVRIIDFKANSEYNSVSAITEMKSIGHSDLVDYGVMISKKESDLDENSKEVIYADLEHSTLIHSTRVKDDIQLMYDFTEGQGSIIYDKAESVNSVDLEIVNPMETSWLPGQGLKVDNNTLIASQNVPEGLVGSIAFSNEITLESWIRTGIIDQTAPAGIVSISKDRNTRLASLGQRGDGASFNYIARLTTTATNVNGTPEIASSEDFRGPSLHHLVYTKDRDGVEKIFINGDEKYSGIREGYIPSSSDNDYIALANDISGERPWIGNYYLVAVYNKALNQKDISKNFEAGAGTVRFSSEINIEHNESYEIRPFARTLQGISFGDPVKIVANDFLRNIKEDSIYIAIYPNPSKGDFKVRVFCNAQDAPHAYIRVSDMMGQVVHYEHVNISEISGEFPISSGFDSTNLSSGKDIDLQLSSIIETGVYLVTLVVGNNSVGRRLIVQK